MGYTPIWKPAEPCARRGIGLEGIAPALVVFAAITGCDAPLIELLAACGIAFIGREVL